jgi:hypothetical protein
MAEKFSSLSTPPEKRPFSTLIGLVSSRVGGGQAIIITITFMNEIAGQIIESITRAHIDHNFSREDSELTVV